MIDIHISIGSNISDRVIHVEQAVALLKEYVGELIGQSALYETSAWGYDGAPFLNMVLILHTGLSPMQSFRQVQMIEARMGRHREAGAGYMDRVIDIDILSYGHRLIDLPELQIPHPRLAERMFVLEPWCEIAPHHRVSGLDRTVESLRQDCVDNGKCEKKVYV